MSGIKKFLQKIRGSKETFVWRTESVSGKAKRRDGMLRQEAELSASNRSGSADRALCRGERQGNTKDAALKYAEINGARVFESAQKFLRAMDLAKEMRERRRLAADAAQICPTEGRKEGDFSVSPFAFRLGERDFARSRDLKKSRQNRAKTGASIEAGSAEEADELDQMIAMLSSLRGLNVSQRARFRGAQNE